MKKNGKIKNLKDKSFVFKGAKILHLLSCSSKFFMKNEAHIALLGGDIFLSSDKLITLDELEKYDVVITGGGK